MGHVGGELPAAFLGAAGGGHVLEEERHAAVLDGAGGHADDLLADADFAHALAGVGQLQHRVVVRHLLQRLAQGIAGDAEHGAHGGVHHQDARLPVEDDQTLAHAVQHRVQLGALGGEAVHLLGEAAVLQIHAVEHGVQLLIGVEAQGMVQVDGVERLHDVPRQAAGQQGADAHAGHRAGQHQEHRVKEGGEDAVLRLRQAQHHAVGQAAGIIDADLTHRVGQMGAPALALGHRVADLLAAEVIAQKGDIASVIKKDAATLIDQRDASAVYALGQERGRVGGGGQRRFDGVGQLRQTVGELTLEEDVQPAGGQRAHQQRRHQRARQQAAQELFTHSEPPSGSPRRARWRSASRTRPASAGGYGCARPRCGCRRHRRCPTRCPAAARG